MSRILSIEIGFEHIAIIGGTKSGDGSFVLEHIHSSDLDYSVISLEADFVYKIADSVRPIISDWGGFDGCAISLNMQSTFFKTQDSQLGLEQLEWEMTQIVGGSLSEYILSVPDITNSDISVLIAMRKEKVEFTKQLADQLGIDLISIGLNLTNFQELVDASGYEYENVILLVMNQQVVEVATIQSGVISQAQMFIYENGLDLNDLNIHLRKLSDFMTMSGTPVEEIFVSGNAALRQETEHIANAVQVPVEIVEPFKSITLADSVQEDENQVRYSALIGGVLN
mgnify:CR=1 FL=1